MQERNEKLVQFPQESSRDVLTDVLHRGAQQMLMTAIEAEVDDYLAARAASVDAAGRRHVVRNGHLPIRAIQTPLGDVRVQQPRVRDRQPVGERETFRSVILPPCLRKTTSLEEMRTICLSILVLRTPGAGADGTIGARRPKVSEHALRLLDAPIQRSPAWTEPPTRSGAPGRSRLSDSTQGLRPPRCNEASNCCGSREASPRTCASRTSRYSPEAPLHSRATSH